MDPESTRDAVRGRSTAPERGLVGRLVEQETLQRCAVRWSDDVPVTRITVEYDFSGGIDAGRRLDGAVATFLLQGTADWETIEALATTHVREFVAANPDEAASTRNPQWEPVVVMVNDERAPARQTIFDGYEVVAFPIDDRVVSSVFSVYDAGDIDASYTVEIWPPTERAAETG